MQMLYGAFFVSFIWSCTKCGHKIAASELLRGVQSRLRQTYSRRQKEMADEDGGGGAGSFVWAIALIIIVAIIAAVVMSGGFFSGGDKKIDVEIKTPAR